MKRFLKRRGRRGISQRHAEIPMSSAYKSATSAVNLLIRCSLLHPTANRFIKRTKSFALESLGQSLVNSPGHARPFIDEASIKLNQAGSGANLFPGIGSRKHSA